MDPTDLGCCLLFRLVSLFKVMNALASQIQFSSRSFHSLKRVVERMDC